jgi:dipeptide/tripeptide permease
MRGSIPRRLRAPVLFVLLALVPLAIGGAAYGWESVLYVAPIVLAVAVGLYVLGGRDSDTGAVIRRQVDDRQADHRLRVQALVGRVMAVAVAVAYSIAVATGSTLWPYAILIGVLAVSILAGWLIYGEHGSGRGDANDPRGWRLALRR